MITFRLILASYCVYSAFTAPTYGYMFWWFILAVINIARAYQD